MSGHALFMNAWQKTLVGVLALSAVGCGGATSIAPDAADETTTPAAPATTPAEEVSVSTESEEAAARPVAPKQAPVASSRIHTLTDELDAPSVSCTPIAANSDFVDTAIDWNATTDFAVDVRHATADASILAVEDATITVEDVSDSTATMIWNGEIPTSDGTDVEDVAYEVSSTEGFVGLVDATADQSESLGASVDATDDALQSLQRELALLHRFDDRFVFSDGQIFGDVAINPVDGTDIGVDATLDISGFEDRDGCTVLRYHASGRMVVAAPAEADGNDDAELPLGMFGIQGGGERTPMLGYSTTVEAQFDPTSGRIVRIAADESLMMPGADALHTTQLLTIAA